ncbi:PH domain-containing protein [Catenuloplanes atrovinosus]|uniref:Membrane protein YdbS with pleckstrin-like domain n=1 Tax=Catenuloplanes atrovinosus TaxID=137266 RepID=A0AAE3YMW1_9ACTN|nr:PH domain-containing protein [Catenuloplanes atrovinosus]MDR7276713.1 membrane protein YdbS with pleckstrin-like domain [Catenuloplanes atrovinosus]
MNGIEIVLALLLGVLVNEFTGVSPWLGRRLAVWSARLRYGDTPRGRIRAEELEAVIDARPGSFLKLATGANLAAASLATRARRLISGESGGPSAEEVLASAERSPMLLEDEPTAVVARYLFPTERYRGEWKRHWVNPVRGTLVILVYGGLLQWLIAIYVRDRYQWWCAAAMGLVTVTLLAHRWCDWHLGRFVITNRRMMITAGVVRRTVAMMPLTRVVDVRYVQSPLGRMLHYGSFQLESASRRNALRVVADVPNPNELYLRLVEEIYEPEAVEARMGRNALPDTDPLADLDLSDLDISTLDRPGTGDPQPPELVALMEKLTCSMDALTAAIDRLQPPPRP